ncbi:CheR family methyltransferase [Marinobacter sp. CHS3-4]|uniref:CheR family methyltransferase n=1 Tax=Marinobacter sp. CHS3-4 TaxID=3045174 RepID=UPI0024B5768A|nr:CheR family methyltransferase [Marinobacter sp. CHS3-4]MDI9245421.1 CheR family methyltransferase [Marinobacter sp. CHS3-4]
MNDEQKPEVSPPPFEELGDKADYPRVVGIGASAGGLEALQTLLEQLPDDTGAAFVITQHLSAEYKSYMDEILARRTTMPVRIVQERESIQPNTVYLNAPKYALSIVDGHIEPVVLDQADLHNPIDLLFSSLAEARARADSAIVVVLSGTGSDGTRGARIAKDAGGLVIVQDPMDAKFDGMPNSVIQAGLADITMDAGSIGELLGQLLRHPLMTNDNSIKQQIATQDDLVLRIFWLLKRRWDVDFTAYKPSTIARRLERRIALSNMDSLQEYFEFLQSNTPEVDRLRNDLLIGTTQFFRDVDGFDYLRHKLLPEMIARKHREQSEPLRIWSVGCSTGEEAYALTIIALEAMEEAEVALPLKVFATDIDPAAIRRAAAAAYSPSILADVSEERLQRYFHQTDGNYTVRKDVRQNVVFSTHNVLADPPFSNIDLCVCRNVLIYLTTPTQRRALSLMHFALRDNGILFLGSSESLGELTGYFSVENESEKLFRKRGAQRIPVEMGQTRPNDRYSNQAGTLAPLVRHRQPGISTHSNMSSVLNYLANTYAPPTIAIDESYQAFHSFGDTTPYTCKPKPGVVDFKIDSLLIDELRIPVLNALSSFENDSKDIKVENVPLSTNGKTRPVTVHIHQIGAERAYSRNALLVSFLEPEDTDASALASVDAKPFDHEAQSLARIRQLETELRDNKEELESSTHDLETTNEELQSTNEELMTANEELQSTNEELQSVNEELHTINSEYQNKIIDLVEAQNDIDKLLEMTHQAVIFLNSDLQIRRFSSIVKTMINLLDQDIGRSIYDVTHQFVDMDLYSVVKQVHASGEPHLETTKTTDNRLIKVHVRPYITIEGQSEGLILSLIQLDAP